MLALKEIPASWESDLNTMTMDIAIIVTDAIERREPAGGVEAGF